MTTKPDPKDGAEKMSESTKAFRCFACGPVEPDMLRLYDGLPVCPHCDEICESFLMCGCGERACADGADECVSCIADQIVSGDLDIGACYGSLKDEVAMELVRRVVEFGKERRAA